VQPGTEFGGYRIEAVQREDAGTAVLLARDPREGHAVALHVAGEPPGALSTVRFLERAHRLGSLAHPHLLGVYDARTLEGRAVAVAQAPPGRRLDELGPVGPAGAVRLVRQLASAVDALERAGTEPATLSAEQIWVDDRGDAHLDALGGAVALAPAASSSAVLARLVGELTARVPRRVEAVLARARDGAYFSAGQFAEELREAEETAVRRRKAAAIALVLLVVAALILLTLR
jgi:serine/threonine-protein kinase